MTIKPILAILGLAALALSSTTGQTLQPADDCTQARIYHLRMALRYDESDAQLYHLNADEAAKRLAEVDADACNGWRESPGPIYLGKDGQAMETRQ